MKQNIFLVLGFFLFRSIVGSDAAASSRPEFRQLINRESAIANIIFKIDGVFSAGLVISPMQRNQIIKKMLKKLPEFKKPVETLTNEKFTDLIKNQIVDHVLQEATVYTDELIKGSYAQSFVKEARTFKLRKTGDDGRGLTKIYWQDLVNDHFYELDREVEVDGIGYDTHRLSREINKFEFALDPIIRSAQIEQIAVGQKYKGSARLTVSNCPQELAYHSGCIKRWIYEKPQCPGGCGATIGRKNLQFNPAYKDKETCAICLDLFEKPATIEKFFGTPATGGAGDDKKRSRS